MFVTKTCDLNIQTEMILMMNMMKNAGHYYQSLLNVLCMLMQYCIIDLFSGKVALVQETIPSWQVFIAIIYQCI